MTDAVDEADLARVAGRTAISQGLAACHTCLKLVPQDLHHCPRCGSVTHVRAGNSLQRCVALLITACILYIPANVGNGIGESHHATFQGHWD